MEQINDWQSKLSANRDKADAMARAAFVKPKTVKSQADGETQRVSLKALAGRLQMDVSACRRYVLRLGYQPMKKRTPDSNFQLALTVSELEARAIQVARSEDGYCEPPK